MVSTSRRIRRDLVVAGLAIAVFGVLLIGHTVAGARSGDYHKATALGFGLGVEVREGPDHLAEFLSAYQWAGTPTITDEFNLEGELAYVPGGCSPLSYVDADVEGKIALVDQAGASDTNPCMPATFLQKVQYAQQAGAIGFLHVPSVQARSNATAIQADIPALDLIRETEKDEQGKDVRALPDDDAAALRDAVKGGATVVVNFDDRRTVYPSMSDRPCEDGFARGTEFACDGVDLLGFVSHKEFNSAGISDLWGWTDEETGGEYVIMGKTNGVAFFRVTDPTAPEYLGELPNPGLIQAVWHDIKVYDDHAFIVSESEQHGMTVFDLTRLRTAEPAADDVAATQWDADARYELTSAAHNLEINEDIGMAYLVGGNAGIVAPDQCLSGLQMVDIRTPKNPTFAGCYALEGGPGTAARAVGSPATEVSPAAYVHDAQCVVYEGPDQEHRGKNICVTAAENKIVVADVSNPLVPLTLGTTVYDKVGYAHQGWFDESQTFWFVNDELAQMRYGDEAPNTRTIVIDLNDLDDPKVHMEYFPRIDEGGMEAITHNNYVVGDRLYQSNYASGLRVADISGVADGQMEEVAFFDTYPTDDDTNFDGTWSNYPFFESGTIAVSGRSEGLFLLRLAEEDTPAPSVELTCDVCDLEVRSGESGTAALTVSNTGNVDDTYAVTVDGLPAGWTATAAPDRMALAAGDAGALEVTIEVPRQERAGSHTLTVSVGSTEHPDVSASQVVVVDVVKGRPSDVGKPDAARGGGDGAASVTPVSAGTAMAGAATDPEGAPLGLVVALLALLTGLGTSVAVRRRATR